MIRVLAGIAALALVVGVRAEEPDPSPLRVHDVTRGSIDVVDSLTARVAAVWCGAASQLDRAPNVVAGNPVHWVYAIPTDGQDRL